MGIGGVCPALPPCLRECNFRAMLGRLITCTRAACLSTLKHLLLLHCPPVPGDPCIAVPPAAAAAALLPMLKLKDFPPTSDFRRVMARHCDDFVAMLTRWVGMRARVPVRVR